MSERVPALIFSVRDSTYGLIQRDDTTLLPWLQRYAQPGPVPGVPSWVLGLLNVQGTVQAIVDLGAFLGSGVSTPTDMTRLIFVEHGALCIGLLVDSASGVRYLDDGVISDDSAEFLVSGKAMVGQRPVQILDGGGLVQSLMRALDTGKLGRA